MTRRSEPSTEMVRGFVHLNADEQDIVTEIKRRIEACRERAQEYRQMAAAATDETQSDSCTSAADSYRDTMDELRELDMWIRRRKSVATREESR